MRLSEPVKRRIKQLAASANLEVHRRDLTHAARRNAALRHHGVETVIDVGANVGQYVTELRTFGFTGHIVSFEPIPRAFQQLERDHIADPRWRGAQMGVGAEPGELKLRVSGDTVTSSFLAPDEQLLTRIPSAATVEIADVEVTTIDSIFGELARNVMLKIDVQGFEHSVLDGAQASLEQISLIEIEMGLVQLYKTGSTIHDLLPRLRTAGFDVMSIHSGYVDSSTGQVLDIDVLLGRR